MELLKFDTYEDYIKAQRKTLKRRGVGPYFTDMETKKICDWMKRNGMKNPIKGVCHGARNGLEADEFKKNFPKCDVFGTDLFPFSGKSAHYRGESDVIEWDFSKQKPEWIGEFDFVYSNSLDHARDPVQVLDTWLEQLKPNGFLFLQWWVTYGIRASGGDCFAASIEECIALVNSVGKLEDLMYSNCPYNRRSLLRRRGLEVVVLAVSR